MPRQQCQLKITISIQCMRALRVEVTLTFSTCVHDAVVKRIRSEETQLDFDSGNLVDGMGPADSGCTDFAETDASDLAFCHKLGKRLD